MEKLKSKLVIESKDETTLEGQLEFENWGHGVFNNDTIQIEFEMDQFEDIIAAVERFNLIDDYSTRRELLDFLMDELEYWPEGFSYDLINNWLKNN